MIRGDVYWVNLDPTAGSEKKTRPCVIVGATPINQARRTVVVIPLSTKGKHNPPLLIEINCLGRKVQAVCDQIRAIDKSRLLEKADSLSLEDMALLETALKQVLCL